MWQQHHFYRGMGSDLTTLEGERSHQATNTKSCGLYLNFPLNLVSLGCLQKRGFDWSHRSGEISKNGQIIGYTRFRGKNYEIGDDESGLETAFATLGADPATLKVSRPYQGPHSAADSDTWHRRMGHISPLGLHMLGKECLGVQLQGKKMSQCTHCAMSKISHQISRRPPAQIILVSMIVPHSIQQVRRAFFFFRCQGSTTEGGGDICERVKLASSVLVLLFVRRHWVGRLPGIEAL